MWFATAAFTSEFDENFSRLEYKKEKNNEKRYGADAHKRP